VLISVKAGRLHLSHVRDLRGVVEREKAEIGLLISMNEPTRQMRAEAATAGFYRSGSEGAGTWGRHAKIQLLTVGELLAGARIDMPPRSGTLGLSRRRRARSRANRQAALFQDDARLPLG
jgi:hypothetical protein